ncbi:hypothetical protein JF536_19840 [Priestia flexa]|jgi:hypothetical protein|nr:hypothetical protein [Priestia flexa]
MFACVVMKRFLERGIVLSEEVLVKILSQAYEQNKTLPIVSLASFFDENSLHFRVKATLPIGLTYRTLMSIQNKTCVQDVLVEVLQVDHVNNDGPVSECVYILTNGTAKEVEQWVEPLQPTMVCEGYLYGEPYNAPQLKHDYRVFAVKW